MQSEDESSTDDDSDSPVPEATCPHGFATIVRRGQCSFDTKAAFAEAIGSRLLVIIDNDSDSPLQRVGGQEPRMGTIGMPSVIITAAAGRYLIEDLVTQQGVQLFVTLTPAATSAVSDLWMELSSISWVTNDDAALVIQINSLIIKYRQVLGKDYEDSEVISWLERKKQAIKSKSSRSSDGEL